ETDGMNRGGGFMADHGAHAATASPSELLGRPRFLVNGLHIVQGPGCERVFVEEHIASSIQGPGTVGIKERVQCDIALQGWAERQTRGDARFVTYLLTAA